MVNQDLSLEEVVAAIVPIDRGWIEKAQARTAELVMPTRALGRLHDLAERLCCIQKSLVPAINSKAVLVMAGDHGIVADGVSAYPQEVTGAMVRTFLAGGAAINVVTRQIGAEVWVVDLGIIPDLDPSVMEGGNRFMVRKIASGTDNFLKGSAMSREAALQAVMTGFEIASELFKQGVEILGTGDMGIGNTSPSAAIGTVMTGCSLNEMVGRGTGVDDPGLSHKREVIRQALEKNRPDPGDALDVLAKVGGFEIGGIAGCILAGAYHHRPVVIDGFISTAGALIAQALNPNVLDYLFAGHRSEENGHRAMLEYLGLEPILDLGMRLGEGTGGAMAMQILETAVRVFTDVMTFSEAEVPDKE